MRIGLLTTSFPYHGEHVAGAFVLGFARALATCGHELEVLAPEPAQACVPVNEPHVRTIHVPYLRPRALQQTFYGAGVLDNLRQKPTAWLGVAAFPLSLGAVCARHEEPWDAFVSHWALPSALIAGHFARGARPRPHLCVFHSADLHLLMRLAQRARFAEQIARGATALWFVTEAQRQQFCSLLSDTTRRTFEKRVTVSPMGIAAPARAVGDRDATRRRLGLARFTVLALSRLVPIKGLDIAVRAAAAVDVTLLIAGDGPEHGALLALSRELRADVRLLGRVAEHEKRALFEAADAFLMPSRTLPDGRSEGVPIALLEALAHGLPAIATATGGMPGIIEDGHSGLLIPADDASALAQAIIQLRLDDALRARLARAGQVRALRCTWSALTPVIETALFG